MRAIVYSIFLAILFPVNALAFDWHGVRSGMTMEQVQEAMVQIGAIEKRSYPDNYWEQFETILFPPSMASVRLDHAGKLLELQLSYKTRSLSMSAMSALKDVLKSKFNARIIAESDGLLAIVIVDEKTRQNDIEHYKRKFAAEL